MKIIKEKKVSRGYRLKPSTHKLLAEIQGKLRTDIDTVISLACKKLTKDIKLKRVFLELF